MRITTVSFTVRFATTLSLLLAGVLLPSAHAKADSSPAEVFTRLANDTWVLRDTSLRELGFPGPIVLGSPDNRREVYLPVPANVPLADATLKLDANYIRANGGRTSMVLSLDGYPVSARAFNDEKGDTSMPLGVDGSPRASGFVRFGVNWTTAIAVEAPCADSRTPGNILRIEPATRFSYRFDGAQVNDLKTAWGALPVMPTVLVSGQGMTKEAYDSAWRIGVALERAGRRARVTALPAIGQRFDLGPIEVPAALKSIPAFAALGNGGMHVVKDAAELGALLALGPNGPIRADVVIADNALLGGMVAAFDALGAQVEQAGPEAAAAFSQWKKRALGALAQAPQAKEVKAGNVLGSPVIVLAPDAGEKAAGLFGDFWRQISLSPKLVVQAAEAPQANASAITLKALGGMPGSFDVLARSEWSVNFGLGAVSTDGRLPNELVLDVSAAPSPARTSPIMSVFLNDVLLASKNLEANGQRERVRAAIPRYALGPANVLRVSFVRQLVSDRCREAPEAFPVDVLPSSHITLKKGTPNDNFSGMFSHYAGGATVLVPQTYLANPQYTLPLVMHLAQSAGVSPTHARLDVAAPDARVRPDGPFIAFDLPFKDARSKLRLDGRRAVLSDGSDRKLIDLAGLEKVGLLEVTRVAGEPGILYRTVGPHLPLVDKAFQLNRGNVAVVGAGGLLTEIDTEDAGGQSLIAETEELLTSRGFWSIVAVLVVAAFIALLVAASRARRRANSGTGE